jgi:signal transduction histidine kinase
MSDASRRGRDEDDRRNRILSAVTHDLKSPVSAMISFADHIAHDMADKPHDPRWIDLLGRIRRAGDQTIALIADILDMARLEAGREAIHPDWVDDPAAQLAEGVESFRMEADARRIALGFTVCGELPSVYWDMERIRYRALNNLVSNALKFTPPRGRVEVTVEAAGETIVITVADTGPGVPEEELERIFLRFEQIDLRTHRISQGAGLGLSNTRHFVALSGGSVTAANRPEGGALFTMRLPRMAAPALRSA